MSLVSFSSEDPVSYIALQSLLDKIVKDALNKTLSEIKAGDRNKQAVKNLGISGKSLVSYCHRVTQNESLQIRETTLDLLVSIATNKESKDWRTWRLQFEEKQNFYQEKLQEGKVEEGLILEETKRAYRKRGSILAGMLSGFLVGLWYLNAVGLSVSDEIFFKKDYNYLSDRVFGVWMGHILGGTFAGWILGVFPFYLSKWSKAPKWKNVKVFLSFVVSFIFFTIIVQSAEREAFLPCDPNDRGKGYLGNFDVKNLALILGLVIALINTAFELSRNYWPTVKQSFWISIKNAIIALLTFLVTASIYRIIRKAGFYELDSWFITCWIRFLFPHAERVWMLPFFGFIYTFILLNVPALYLRWTKT